MLCPPPYSSYSTPLTLRLDSQALTLLTSLLTSGNSLNHLSPAFVPPPQHLALAATLALHPSLTTRARSADRLQAANLALRYLRLIHHHVGPINANFGKAFAFTNSGISSRRGGSGRRRTGEDASPVAQDVENVNTELANIESLWARAEDFWHVVGWAFNCSVVHKRRWERWRVWLEYMLQVLEDDWNLRRNIMDVNGAKEEEDPRERSLIVNYVNADGSRGGKERRVVRAIFADGSPRAMTEFKEIWRNEPKERKKDGDVTKKIQTKVNVDEEVYGDYLKDEEGSDLADENPSFTTNPPSPTPEGPGSDIATLSGGTAILGGIESINLRLRLLSLLSSVSATLPDLFTPITTLYTLYHDAIRPLPLPTFSILLSPSSLRFLTPPAASSLTQYILRSLISSSAPLPAKDDLTQDVLEESYLPYAANTGSIADNAKMSLCVEALVRLWNGHVGLEWSQDLDRAVDAGIQARETKAKSGGRGRRKGAEGDGGGEEDRVWLRGSAERIRGLVDMVKP